MSSITITIRIDVPEGSSVKISQGGGATFGDLPLMDPDTGETADGGAICPDHHIAFTWKEPGVSANGKPYDGFWKCGIKLPTGGYCQRKPK